MRIFTEVIKQHFAKNDALAQRLLEDGKQKLYEIERETEKFNVKFVVQEVANGLAGAILCAEPYVKDQPFALLLGDELLYAEQGQTPCIKTLIDVYEKTGKSVIAAMEVFGDDVSKYGNIGIADEVDGVMLVSEIKEKPSVNEALSNYAIIGRYVISGKVMDMLKTLTPRNNEIYFTDALDQLSKSGELLASPYEGVRYDVGDKLGYVKANVEFALKSKEIGVETAEFIKELASKL